MVWPAAAAAAGGVVDVGAAEEAEDGVEGGVAVRLWSEDCDVAGVVLPE